MKEDIGLRLRTVHHGGQLVRSTFDLHFRGIIHCQWDWRAPWFFRRCIRFIGYFFDLRFTFSGGSLFLRREIILLRQPLQGLSEGSLSYALAVQDLAVGVVAVGEHQNSGYLG